MTKRMFLAVLALCAFGTFGLTATAASAPTLGLTDAGVKNIGSSIAYLMQCEVAQHLALGNSTAYLNAVHRNVLPERAAAVRRQLQLSLHEKTVFSPSQNLWITFAITKENCEDAAKSVPVLVYQLDNSVR